MTSPGKYAAIREVLQHYIDGSYRADINKLKTCFHPKAAMSGYLKRELDIGTPQPFYDELEGAKSSKDAGEDYQAEIGFIHVVGPIASAAVIEDNLLGTSYVNHFHLLEIEGTWRIISKIYTDVD